MKRELLQSTTFIRAARKLIKKQPEIAETLRSVFKLLVDDAFAVPLRTHKLKGELTGVWACSAGYDLRILFEFVQNNGAEAILLLTIGTHEEVY